MQVTSDSRHGDAVEISARSEMICHLFVAWQDLHYICHLSSVVQFHTLGERVGRCRDKRTNGFVHRNDLRIRRNFIFRSWRAQGCCGLEGDCAVFASFIELKESWQR